MPVSTIQNASLASGVPGRANLPTGSVLQVVSTTITSQQSFAGGAVDVSGLSATITPTSASNKILVLLNVSFSNGNNGDAFFNLLRGASQIPSGIAYSLINGAATGAFTNSMLNLGATYLDSPSTTSATTYKIQAATSGITMVVNRRALDGGYTGQSTITLMEIAA